jgi:hypothetical protein
VDGFNRRVYHLHHQVDSSCPLYVPIEAYAGNDENGQPRRIKGLSIDVIYKLLLGFLGCPYYQNSDQCTLISNCLYKISSASRSDVHTADCEYIISLLGKPVADLLILFDEGIFMNYMTMRLQFSHPWPKIYFLNFVFCIMTARQDRIHSRLTSNEEQNDSATDTNNCESNAEDEDDQHSNEYVLQ